MSHQKILILDFGSQVTQLIARRVREAHVYCEVHPCDVSSDWVKAFAADGMLKGVILSGSHASVYEESTDRAPDAVFELGIPVLGICYGMQTMAQQLGGKVASGQTREFGYAEVRAHGHTRLLNDLADFTTPEGHGMLKVWMSHGDKVVDMPPGFSVMASTPSCPIAGMADETRGYYALQFHPEVTHTVQGAAMLRRFVLDICGTSPDWIMGDYVSEAVARIREQVGDQEVILGLSGGVDSSVAAALIHRAIGDQLTCVFVDHGLLRLNEGDMVMEMFAGKLHARVIRVDASELFLGQLAGVDDPEKKRKIIGGLFVDVFKAEAAKLKAGDGGHKGATFLAQGTIYPDVIESGGAKSKKKPSPSRVTTTWAAYLSNWGSSCWSRCVICSRMKSESWVWRSAYRTTWCTATHSQAPGWAYASWVKSKRNMQTCCVKPMPSSSRNYAISGMKQRVKLGTS